MSPDASVPHHRPVGRSPGAGFFLSEAGLPQLVRLWDVGIFGVVAATVYSIHVAQPDGIPWGYCAAVMGSVMLIVSFFHRFGLYDVDTIVAWPRRMGMLVVLMGVALALLAGLAFALKVSEGFSRVWTFTTFGASTALMITVRGAILTVLRRRAKAGEFRRNLAIVGAGLQAEKFLSHMRAEKAPWQNVVGVFDDRETRIARTVGNVPVRGGLGDLFEWVREGLIDSVVIALPWSADVRVMAIIQQLRELPINVYVATDLVSYRFPASQSELLGGAPTLRVGSIPLLGWGAIIKNIEDRMLAGLAMIPLAPLMLGIALAIRLDSPGPILFRQDRYGFNNQRITVLKFRSMYHNRPPEAGVPQATKDDSRVTRVGRILRKTSLDELPQILNVLTGSMSLVGPRPHAVEHNRQYSELIAGYYARHKVKPGITGWAQVKGYRGETASLELMKARVNHDIYYIENWSPWLDLKILALTVLVVWRQKTAY